MTKIVIVDPVSSGASLAEAFRERGVETFHVYQPELEAAFASDPPPGGKLLHTGFGPTLSALRRYGPDAVLAGSEVGVTLADALAAALGLPHNAVDLARARRDKFAMAQALRRAGVPHAATAAVSGEGELETALPRFVHYPVVVKPAASAGSDGLAICDTEAQVYEAVRGLLGRANLLGRRNDVVVLQEYLAGPHYILDTVSVAGRHVVSDVLTVRFDEVEGRPIQRHKTLKVALDPKDRAVVAYGLRCLDALGVSDGAAHTEIRLTDAGPRLIEVNCRLMGPILPSDPYLAALGHSQATLFADAVLKKAPFEELAARPYAPRRPFAVVFLRAQGAGTVRAMPGLDVIRRLPTFRSFAKLPSLGTEIKDPLLTTGTAGLAYFVGTDAAAVLADVDRVHALEDSGLLYEMHDPADGTRGQRHELLVPSLAC
ncbi:ATP-grasp domain-containing protein [Streptomyces sp. NPDC002092]